MINAGTMALLAAGLVGCATTNSDRQMAERNFGVVELSPQIPKRMKLGDHKDCVVTLTTLPDGNFRSDAGEPTGAASPALPVVPATNPTAAAAGSGR